MGLSFRLTSRRGMPLGMTRDSYVLGYFEFVKRLHDSAFFNIDSQCLICVDFVTNSQRRELERTLSLIGGKQQKFAKSCETVRPWVTWQGRSPTNSLRDARQSEQ